MSFIIYYMIYFRLLNMFNVDLTYKKKDDVP